MEFFLCVLGMVFVVESLPYIAFPSKIKILARQVEGISEKHLQIFGIIAAFTGLGIIYVGRSLGGM